MERTWKWFVRIDIAVTLAEFVAIGGYYVWCFFKLSDTMLLGAMIMFFLDAFGLPLLALAALVLLVSWRSQSHLGVLLGSLCQLLYGGAYTFFFTMAGAFVTPGFMGGPVALAAGVVGVTVCLTIPKDRRGWKKPVRRTLPPPGEID